MNRDRGSVMPMTTVFIALVMVGVFALVCASQAWGQRRHIQGVADAAARAAAQLDGADVRRGAVIDASAAHQRAAAAAAGTGVSVSVVAINGLEVTVAASGSVDYAFPVPGFPESMTATGTAVAQVGVVAPGG